MAVLEKVDQTTAPRRSRILFLSHRVPYPPNRGDRIRSFHLIEFLARRADVSLAFLAEQPPAADTLQALECLCVQVAGIPLSRCGRWLHAAWSMARGRTATEGLFRSRRLRRVLARWAKVVRFDAVVVFCSSMVQYMDVARLADVPALVDLVDVDSQKWFDYADKSTGLRRRLYQIEGRRLRRLEQSLPDVVDAITLVSRCEVDLYRSFCPTDAVHAVTNGVDLEYFCPAQDTNAVSPPRCIFVGALDYHANIDGVQWFCDEVWPKIQQRRPDATFTLVGGGAPAAIEQLGGRPGVRLTGDVADVRPFVADATLVVVPLRIARGVQNKVLEALAMAKAVIATPQALEGLDVTPGVNVRSADTPAEWIDAILKLSGDARERYRLGGAGRSYVETHHRWDRVLQPLATLLGLDADPPKGT